MVGFFRYFPLLSYSSFSQNDENEGKLSTDIFARSTIIKSIIENTSIYYEYELKDTDTPEIIAAKLYGRPERNWVILLFNQITNPYYEFPLSKESLEIFIKNKYDQTIEQSLTTIHHYELESIRIVTTNGFVVSNNVTKYEVTNKIVDFDTGQLTPRTVPGTADTYLESSPVNVNAGNNTIVTTKEKITAISNYTHELNLNEARRKIRLIDPLYVDRVENELIELMRYG